MFLWARLKLIWTLCSNKSFFCYLLKWYKLIQLFVEDLCKIPGWESGFDFVDCQKHILFEEDIESQLKVSKVVENYKEVFKLIKRHPKLNIVFELLERELAE